MRRFSSKKVSSKNRIKKSKRKSSKNDDVTHEGGDDFSNEGGVGPSSSEGALAAVQNELDMLHAENRHLKRLVEQKEQTATATALLPSARRDDTHQLESETLRRLRRERDEFRDVMSIRQKENEALQLTVRKLQNELALQEDAYKKAAILQDSQIEHTTILHEDEMKKMQSHVDKLSVRIEDLEAELAAAADTSTTLNIEAEDEDSLRKQVADLHKKFLLAKLDAETRVKEVENLRKELRRVTGDEESVSAMRLEIQKLKLKLTETSERATLAENRVSDFYRQIEELSRELENKLKDLVNLEEELQLLKNERNVSEGGEDEIEGGVSAHENADMKELRKELEEKQKAVWDLSERILNATAENDQLQDENRKLKVQLEETTSQLELQRSSSHSPSKKEKKHSSSSSSSANLGGGGGGFIDENEREKMHNRIVDLEKNNTAAEKENSALKYESKTLQNDLQQLQTQVKRLEGEKEALKLSKEQNALMISQKVIFPLPREGVSDTDRLRVEVQLKEIALRRVCMENEKLTYALKQLADYPPSHVHTNDPQHKKGSEALTSELLATRKQLLKLKTANAQLQNELEETRRKDVVLHKQSKMAKDAIQEIQNRKSMIASKYREQIDVYVKILGEAHNEIERLQNELSAEKLRHARTARELTTHIVEMKSNKIKYISVKEKSAPKICDFIEEEEEEEKEKKKKQTNENDNK